MAANSTPPPSTQVHAKTVRQAATEALSGLSMRLILKIPMDTLVVLLSAVYVAGATM